MGFFFDTHTLGSYTHRFRCKLRRSSFPGNVLTLELKASQVIEFMGDNFVFLSAFQGSKM